MKRPTLLLPSPRSLILGLASLSGMSTVLADTTLTFDGIPAGQQHNAAVVNSFGDNVLTSSTGVSVTGAGTPDIDLTFGGAGSGRWDYYDDGGAVWRAAQMDNGAVSRAFDITFTPTPEAGVAIKSFNLHPYYDTTFYEYVWSVLDEADQELASGTATTLTDGSKVPVEINYQGELGQLIKLRLLRTGGDGRADSIAIDDLVFGQLPETPQNPQVAFQYPIVGTEVSPETRFEVVIRDGIRRVAPATIRLSIDDQVVPAEVTTVGDEHRITYSKPEPLLEPGSTHVYQVAYQDTEAVPMSYTHSISGTVQSYSVLQLPDPIVFEGFDGTVPGELPQGWSTAAYIPGLDPELNIDDLNSASFEPWLVIPRDRFSESFLSYTDHVVTTDYRRVLTPNVSAAVNGSLVKQLGSGNIVFSTSGYRSGSGQYMALFSPDFDLTGRTEIYLSLHSLWEQNQDSIAVIEYSIDEGASWLPVSYFLAQADVREDGEGNVDAITTFTTEQPDTARFTDADTGETRGTKYEDYILAPVTEELAPFVHARVDDNAAESKRVEFFPLPMADNQPKVRFRFAHAGTDSWYWGIDNVGLYSLSAPPRLEAVKDGGLVRISWTGGGDLESAPAVGGPWTKVPADQIINQTYSVNPGGSGASFLRLR